MANTLKTVLFYILKFPLHILKFCFQLIRSQIFGGRLLIKQGTAYYVPAWVLVILGIGLVFPFIWDDVAGVAKRVVNKVSLAIVQLSPQTGNGEIAPFFASSVQHWSEDISEWSALYDVDTQLMATVMQIESCGHPTVVSSAGARGLFQVMPFHFEAGEDMVEPNTNAKRGGLFLNYCYNASDGDIGLTLACYNGGPSVINRPLSTWANETQRYYRWGVGIYSDAIMNRNESDTLNQWLTSGGSRLCASAMNEIRTYSPSVASLSSW